MKKRLILIFTFIFIFTLFFTRSNVFAASYLADKAEIPVSLNSSGARAICQTDDGHVWIGQFTGVTRYDSNEMVTFNSFIDEKGKEIVFENVRLIEDYNNKIYMVSSIGLLKYDDHKFSKIELNNNPTINSLLMTKDGILYISSTLGLYVYNTNTNKITKNDSLNFDLTSITIIDDKIYYLKDNVVYDYNNNEISDSTSVVKAIYSINNILIYSTTTRKIFFYDTVENEFYEDTITLSKSSDMAYKFTYSPNANILFAACEKGLYSIDMSPLTDETESEKEKKHLTAIYADKLEKSSKLVDLMIDYENNLWVVSYISGVSIITQSDLVDLLFDVSTKIMPEGRLIYAIQKYDNELYLATDKGIFVFNLEKEIIDVENPLITQINNILENNPEQIPFYDIRDVEIFNNKMYFATYGSGLFEYDLETKIFTQYRGVNIAPDVENPESKFYLVAQRCLKTIGDYLYIGTGGSGENSIIRFDGENFLVSNLSMPNNGQILYIDESIYGDVTFVCSGNGIYTIDSDLNMDSIKLLSFIDENTSGILKFYQDDDYFYYNIYGRLFAVENETGEQKEIKIPYINGSITEINKVRIAEGHGEGRYKYVIASEKQIYIFVGLVNEDPYYEYYDSSNGLKSPIKGNTSGYYDSESKLYYFQSQDGVFVYNFTEKTEAREPLKIEINSVLADKNVYYGNNITISKKTERITFNLSTFSFKPTKGYTVYYKLDGVDKHYIQADESTNSVTYTNLDGGKYKFHIYVVDELGQKSNQIDITINKPLYFYEYKAFWVFIIIIIVLLVVGLNVFIIRNKIKKSIKRQNEYRKITVESIEAIARTIDAKDAYTNGHSKRVGIYSREIAKALQLSQDEIDNIYYIALLHDIGKISIPLDILNKPGRLTDEEFNIMKSHTTAGGKILEGISTIPHIVEGAMYHHERYGGGGYPKGLVGEDIPFIARIICCADCYDAMATKRVYKEPYTKDKIISEFERCKGSQFDPMIADLVIKLIKEDRLRYGTELKKNEEEKSE